MKKKSAISTNEPDAFHSKKNGIMFWVGYKPQALLYLWEKELKLALRASIRQLFGLYTLYLITFILFLDHSVNSSIKEGHTS